MPTRDQIKQARDRLAIRAAIEKERTRAKSSSEKVAMLRAKLRNMRKR